MSSSMNSMLKLILEEQERGMAWLSTSYQEAYESSTSREYQPDWNYAQGNQCGYGERFQSSNMEYGYGELYSSQISKEEENCNLLKLMLEEQEKFIKSIRMIDTKMDASIQGSRVVEAMRVESINTELSQWIEDKEEECIPFCETINEEMLPIDIGEVLEKDAPIKDNFLNEANEFIKEFELLLGCTVDENLVIRYEDQVEPVAIMSYSTKSNEEGVGVVGKPVEDPCEGVMVVECILYKHLGIISTHEVRIDEPKKIFSEAIRMKEFRGWFYDEYDPGDTWIHH